ncbi:MAG: flagellar motor protein MotB [Bdellovibrionales bacterium]|nr:flagellar motor protein MotB [Bdellovibrionales bacterium]
MKKRHRISGHEEAESTERWLVSYADFITLMFAFFTVLYATSERDLDKTKKFQESIKQFLVKAGSFGGSGDQIKQGEKFETTIDPPIQTYQKSTVASAKIEDDVTEQIEKQFSQEFINRFIIDLTSDDYGARIVLSAQPIFKNDSDNLQTDAVVFLNLMGKILQSFQRKIVVEGHAQSEDVDKARNLSARRSDAVIRFFTRTDKSRASNYVSIALGNQRPLVTPDDPNSDRLNNRIEIRVLTDDSPF